MEAEPSNFTTACNAPFCRKTSSQPSISRSCNTLDGRFAIASISFSSSSIALYIARRRCGRYSPPNKPCQYASLAVSYTHLRAHETDSYLVCRLLLEKKKNSNKSEKKDLIITKHDQVHDTANKNL